MKEDILEQIVEDYLQFKGYFTRHNIKFRPDASHLDYVQNQDANHSDIDVVGINPLKSGPERVIAVSCKSWQGGLNLSRFLKDIEEKRVVSGRDAWKFFRELVSPKWGEAFVKRIEELTGERTFTYYIAATLVKGDRNLWQCHKTFLTNLSNNPIKVISLAEMLDETYQNTNTTVANSEIGRLLQLVKASSWNT